MTPSMTSAGRSMCAPNSRSALIRSGESQRPLPRRNNNLKGAQSTRLSLTENAHPDLVY
jgi:hypothetical protein